MPGDRPVVLLVRHGETEWNATRRMQGQADVPLSPRGLEQARALAARLSGERPARIVSSDLVRAKATADAIGAATALPVEVDVRLREDHMGEWQGLTFAQASLRDPEAARRFAARDPDARPPGGQSRAELAARSLAALDDLAAAGSPSPLVLVTHGGVIMSIVYAALGLAASAPRRFLLPNAAITTLRSRGDLWFVRTLNDTAHLTGPDTDSFPFE